MGGKVVIGERGKVGDETVGQSSLSGQSGNCLCGDGVIVWSQVLAGRLESETVPSSAMTSTVSNAWL